MRVAVERSEGRRRRRSAVLPASLLQETRWAAARLIFLAYIGFSMATLGIGGFLTGPIMTWYFYGDWRVWRVWRSAWRLFPHAYKMLGLVLRGYNGGFMLGVPLNETWRLHTMNNKNSPQLSDPFLLSPAQRTARMGIEEKHCGHSFVVGSAAGASSCFLSLLMLRIRMKMANATMRKLTMVLINMP